MRVLKAEEMREVDRRAIEDLGIPGMVLMENAAIGLADAIGEKFPRVRRVAILCGPGNNGGDGLALARQLDGRGYSLDVFLVGEKKPAGDAATQLAILERIPLPVESVTTEAQLAPLERACARADLVVDALFGTGLTRPLAGLFARAVEVMGAARRPLLAVDLPSGLDASRPEPMGPTLRADLSVTFAAPRVAHCLEPAASFCGEVVVTDLGIPRELIEQAPGSWHLIGEDDAAALLPPRPRAGHKGTFGHAVLVGGSAGKSGAIALAARGALRGGAGLVSAAVPAELLPILEQVSLESMTLALPGACAVDAWPALRDFLENKDAVGLGPGLGASPDAVAFARVAAGEIALPLVVDADGLNALAGDLAPLRARSAPTVLTPHPGEMARLLGLPGVAEVERDRPAAALALASASGAVVVLKGAPTLVATPEGELWINGSGGPALATGGSGDVLTGLLTALLAQGLEAAAAAQLAVYAHGAAGDLLAATRGPFGLVAGDIAEALPAIWRRLAAGEGEA